MKINKTIHFFIFSKENEKQTSASAGLRNNIYVQLSEPKLGHTTELRKQIWFCKILHDTSGKEGESVHLFLVPKSPSNLKDLITLHLKEKPKGWKVGTTNKPTCRSLQPTLYKNTIIFI